MRTATEKFFFILVVIAISTLSYAQESVLKFNLKPGQYTVGFKVVHQYDYSRSFAKYDMEGNLVNESGARPIQTSIWYPAKKGKKSPMLFEEYVSLITSEINFSGTAAKVFEANKNNLKIFNSSTDEIFERELKTGTNAIKEADAVKGSFPVVVYAPSFQEPSFDNSVLCEFIASHGYIVVSSPSVGMNSRDMTVDIPGLEAQAMDIGFLISFMHRFPNADINNIAVMGYSWGGYANVFAKMRNDNIKALISLEGSIRYDPGFFRDSPYGDISRIDIPFLYLAAKDSPLEEVSELVKKGELDVSYNIYNELKYSDAYLITFNQLNHQDFMSLAIKLGERTPETGMDQDLKNRNYEIINLYVLNFLNAYLKKDKQAIEYMTNSPEENGIKPCWLSKQSKKAQEKPPTLNGFAAILNKNGFKNAYQTFEEIKKRSPDFSFTEEELNYWAWQLSSRNEREKAIEVYKLLTKLYPNSPGS